MYKQLTHTPGLTPYPFIFQIPFPSLSTNSFYGPKTRHSAGNNLVCSRRKCSLSEPSCFQGIILVIGIGLASHHMREVVGFLYLPCKTATLARKQRNRRDCSTIAGYCRYSGDINFSALGRECATWSKCVFDDRRFQKNTRDSKSTKFVIVWGRWLTANFSI